MFKELTKLSLPSWPIITRWGTWLKFGNWIFNNFKNVKKIIKALCEDFSSELNAEIREIIEEELRVINRLSFIPDAILH